MNDSFVFYRSFIEAVEVDGIADDVKLQLLKAIIYYALDDSEPDEETSPVVKMAFKLIKPQIDANVKRRLNGAKGGRKKEKPMVNKNETIGYENKNHRLANKEPMVTELKTNGSQNENHRLAFSEPNVNVNVNDNVNVNANGNVNVNVSASADIRNPLITEQEKNSLVADYGEDVVEDYINRVQHYCTEHNKTYKDYALTIRTWLNRDGVKKRDNHLDIYNAGINDFDISEFEEVS